MSVLGLTTGAARNPDADGYINLIGVPGYDTGDVPPGSAAAQSIVLGGGEDMRRPWYDGVLSAARREPSGTNYWFGLQVKRDANSSFNDQLILGVERSGAEIISVSAEDNTNRITIRVNGTAVATASTEAFGVNQWKRLHVSVDQQSGGLIRVFVAGDLSTPVVSHTITGGEAGAFPGAPDGFRLKAPSTQNTRLADVWAMDPDDGVYPTNINDFTEATIVCRVPTGNGDQQDWAGSYTDIDEVPPSDADSISTSTVDNASVFAFDAIAQDKVLHVQSLLRVTRTNNDAGENLQVRKRKSGGPETDEATTAAPGDGHVIQQSSTGVSGVDWTPAELDATQFGVVART